MSLENRVSISMTLADANDVLLRSERNIHANLHANSIREDLSKRRKPDQAEREHLQRHIHNLTQEEMARLKNLIQREMHALEHGSLANKIRSHAGTAKLMVSGMAAGGVARLTGGRLQPGIIEQALITIETQGTQPEPVERKLKVVK